MGCVDLELAVPGTYEPNQPVVHIRRVSATLNVITSKQRPRKLVIQGENKFRIRATTKTNLETTPHFWLTTPILIKTTPTMIEHSGCVPSLLIRLWSNERFNVQVQSK